MVARGRVYNPRMPLNRRKFLGTSVILPAFARTAWAAQDAVAFKPMPDKWRRFELTTRVEILKPEGEVRAWIPMPSIEAGDWIKPNSDSFTGNGKVKVITAPHYDANIACVEWPAGIAAPVVEARSQITTRDRSIDLSKPALPQKLSESDRKLFTSATKLIPTDGLMKETALKIVGSATDDVEKARRIYEWIVINTFRDPKVRGCGTGDVSSMLKTGNFGGKCADLNALFVGLARASGLPARDLYGIRVAPSKFGYKALGANSETVTKSQHCRAEVFLSRFGWVPVDPADVRKVVLEEPPGNLPLADAKVEAAHRTLIGAWEGNWIAYNDAHDVELPGSLGSPVAFLMYPQAETSAGRLDPLDADQFKYTITAKEL